MEPFKTIQGFAAPMLKSNIDTDVIMPKQFLKGIDRSGLDKGVFFDQRFLPDGAPNPEFILNQPKYSDAKFLLTGPNFGCGSSREHAVWGLKQLDIRALIGTSFAGIFFDNCMRNGVLIAQITEEQLQAIAQIISAEEKAVLIVDLPKQEISVAGHMTVKFNIDELRKETLLEGLDPISATLQHRADIQAFEKRHLAENPWLA